MKKEIIICAIVIVLVIALNSITGNYTKNSVDSVTGDLKAVKGSIQQNKERKEISEEVSNAKSNWDDKYKKLAYYLEHDELEKVTLHLVGLDSNINSEQYPQAMEELDKCIYILEHLEDKYSFDLRNIF